MNHCKDCAAFVRKTVWGDDIKTGETVAAPSEFGECRRHAPVVLGTPRQGMTQSQGWWPVVRENDGCLDFHASDTTQKVNRVMEELMNYSPGLAVPWVEEAARRIVKRVTL